jgi:hypothetical protein
MRGDQHDWIYRAYDLAKISENKVVLRLMDIGIECLRPFDDAGLRRILTEPWHVVKKIPALSRQIRKRDHGNLYAVTAARLSSAEKQALRDLARKNKTTMSALQRQAIERILAKEA